MIKNLYLFRHGQTDHNAHGVRYGGAETGELTELGVAQATGLSQYLAKTKIDAFYSSPYERAVHTAKIVAERHPDTPLVIDDRLAEAVYWWDEDDWETTPEWRKQRDANFERIKEFFDELVADSEYKNVAVASHGGVT